MPRTKGKKNSKGSRRMVIATERAMRALEYRKMGASYTQIAKELGITRQGAFKAVTRVLADARKTISETAEDMLTLELARLDQHQMAIAKTASAGDIPAVMASVKISESRRRLLGLDAPTKNEHSGPGGGPMAGTLAVQVTYRIVDPTQKAEDDGKPKS